MNTEVKIAIFDIDGCISDDEWRLPMIKKEGDDRYRDYHAAAEQDRPLPQGANRLKHHIHVGHKIVFITARPDYMRIATGDWLRKHFPLINTPIMLMRDDDEEGIGAVVIKCQRLVELRNTHKGEIVAAYDDRPDIIEMYLSNGIHGARILDKNGIAEFIGQPTVISYEENPAKAKSQLAKGIADFNSQMAMSATKLCSSMREKGLIGLEYPVTPTTRTAADILEAAGATFRERNAVYKDNAEVVGNVMKALFPEGVRITSAADHKMYHLFELVIVKLTRFTQSGLTHTDSIHDLAVYAAMCENLASTHSIKFD